MKTPEIDLLPYPEFVGRYFPGACSAPFAPRHEKLWNWFGALTPGVRPPPRVECLPRAGAKSSTGEMATAWIGTSLRRRFVLYVCATQDQADTHVLSIASLFEAVGVERRVNKFGRPTGWNRQHLRTANGFNVTGIGLDKAVRGIKVDQYRPDLIIFDDIDNREDTAKTIEKKIRAITLSIMPTGSNDCAYLFLQNLIHEQSILAQLVDGTADFCRNREVGTVEPALFGMETEVVTQQGGANIWRITAGEPSWAGQSRAICEEQINTIGLAAFEQEMQHKVEGAKGYVFDVTQIRSVSSEAVPPLVAVCLSGDLAATEGGGDWTVYPILGKAKNGQFYVLAVLRGQWSPDRVQGCLKVALSYYRRLYPQMQLRLPQDPGAAGKILAFNQRNEYGSSHQLETGQRVNTGPIIQPVTGSKAMRASGAAKETNRGNVFLVEQDLPEVFRDYIGTDGKRKPLITDLSWQSWHKHFRNELRAFREDELDQTDDQVDAFADGFNHLSRERAARVLQAGKAW